MAENQRNQNVSGDSSIVSDEVNEGYGKETQDESASSLGADETESSHGLGSVYSGTYPIPPSTLVAHYEAQMRECLNVFTHAAAGAAWAALSAQIPPSPQNLTQAYLPPMEPSAQPYPPNPPPPPPPPSYYPPYNSNNVGHGESYRPVYARMQMVDNPNQFPLDHQYYSHRQQAHNYQHHPQRGLNLDYSTEIFDDERPSETTYGYDNPRQQRQRHRGRNDYSVSNQSHPNKRHHKMQGRGHNNSNWNDDSSTRYASLGNKNDHRNNFNVTTHNITNKRPHYAVIGSNDPMPPYLQGSSPPPPPLSPNYKQNHSASRMLWSPHSKTEEALNDDKDNHPRRRIRSSSDFSRNNNSSYRKLASRNTKAIKKSSSGNLQNNSNNKSNETHPRPFNPVGKTGVMALHELCSKKHWKSPNFIEVDVKKVSRQEDESSSTNNSRKAISHANSFTITVEINGKELGRGRGGTKAAARQDAARQALIALLPGTSFDENGILTAQKQSQQQHPDDLAPLASRLAIHSAKPYGSLHDSTISSCVKSEDEDSYFASRGASVCSTLLHAMWQIDRIKEPPKYVFEMTSITSHQSTVQHRSSFVCTGTIVIATVNDDDDSGKTKLPATATGTIPESLVEGERVTAVGTGATKREAKHATSAKLLGLLFPRHDGMVDVITAAETEREKYAASKAATKLSKKNTNSGTNITTSERNEDEKVNTTKEGDGVANDLLASIKDDISQLSQPDDPALLNRISVRLSMLAKIYEENDDDKDKDDNETIVEEEIKSGSDSPLLPSTSDNIISVAALSLSESKDVSCPSKSIEKDEETSETEKSEILIEVGETCVSSEEEAQSRKEFEEMIDSALQKLSEQDEECRISSGCRDERIVLRRAQAQDRDAILKLLLSRDGVRLFDKELNCDGSCAEQVESSRKKSSDECNEAEVDFRFDLDGPLSIVLLFSKSFTEDVSVTILGCTFLTFQEVEERSLNLCRMVYEPQLSKEQIMDYMAAFALHMRCGLQIIGTSSGPSRGSEDDGQQSPAEEEDQTSEKSAKGRRKSSSTMTEECIEEVTTTESSERDGIKSSGTIDSSSVDGNGASNDHKPSKRSRVS